MWPGFALKSIALFFATAAVLAGMGGLAQINPIWIYGPFRTAIATTAVTSASQPDWYVGWLDGALRLYPAWELRIGGFSIPNPFVPGVLMPTIVFAVLYAWPWLERRVTADTEAHNLLDRPRDAPNRTAIGAGAFTFFAILFVAGSNDVLAATGRLSPESLTWFFRFAVFIGPAIVFFVTRRICRELARTDTRPLRGCPGTASCAAAGA